MAFEKVEFNFPTEEKGDDLEIESSSAVELDAEIPIDVEIVDDTPEVDRTALSLSHLAMLPIVN